MSKSFEYVHSTIHGNAKNIMKILTTCEEMLRDRGYYQVQRTNDVEKSISHTSSVVWGEKENGQRIDIYMSDDDKVGVKYARQLLEKKINAHFQVIIVSTDGPTPFARKEGDGHDVQFMTAKNLCFNVTQHALVPKHEVVEKPPNGLRCEQLPRILEVDPIVQYYNWPVGTIVRVSRCYAGHETISYFRYVVSS